MADKRIVYTITFPTGAMAGPRPEPSFAYLSEELRDKAVDAIQDNCAKGEQIVNFDERAEKAIAKLNAVDKLVLGLACEYGNAKNGSVLRGLTKR